ncbi:HpcH/HpaI aldolase family protein [Halovenus marina]|uniref:HpcH/HpaI aldolase family protein n=1 Tax=Halovenus marina TaxID=3396621 RepID=UPI003F57E344
MSVVNCVQQAAETDEVFVGAGVASASPTVVEIYGNLGMDFALLDLEHVGFSAWDSERLEALTRAADVVDIDLIVRIPSGDASSHPPLIRKVLDTGVRNVLVPRVSSREEVTAAVEAGYFYPDDGDPGERGFGGGRSSRWGPGMMEDGYIDREDDSVQIGIMVENRDAVEALDELLSVPGLGFAFTGPADLSHSLDHPLELDDPAVRDALRESERTIAASDVTLGSMFVDDVEASIERGNQLLILGSDYSALYDHYGELLDSVAETIPDDSAR